MAEGAVFTNNLHIPITGRVRSLGTTSLFNELSTTQEEEDCHTDFNNRPLTKRATTFDLLRSSTHHHQDPLLTSSIGQSSITSNHNPNSSDRTSPSLRTVISKSSLKIFNKLPGLKSSSNKRSSSSGGSIVINNNQSSPSSIPPHPHPSTHPHQQHHHQEGSTELRTSTSSLFSNSPIKNNHQQQNMNSLRNNHPTDYLPNEKSRSSVSRSSDFLALRYLSIHPDLNSPPPHLHPTNHIDNNHS
ncbi:hypothetical protein PSTG_18206 [Puccinia striiformis f. sp. tritici PST-78]|uniref:Uncharacterized protein n=1 Tax=Puccinia striiformis f. sp. tritici PST-78 TaxID=1165861 RepID=A0A0L0UNQ8_9BASI|nr:hypothetical protein PSTG_18206 [Puccinia striiformis f. sp. tritici PST-78]